MESQYRRMAIKFFAFLVGVFLLTIPVYAAEDTTKDDGLNTTFPGSGNIIPGDIGSYLVAFYQFFISAIAIMAVVVIMFAGFRWMTAQGNQERVSKAKETLWGAVIGVFLALISWVVLNFIDPNIKNLSLPDINSFMTPAKVQPATVCSAKESELGELSVVGDEAGRNTYTPNCGETYTYQDYEEVDGKTKLVDKYCHGWEANLEEDACYFAMDTLTQVGANSDGYAHYVGTEVSILGQQQLNAMGWVGGKKEANTSSIDIDCSGADGDCSDDEKQCGWIWWQDGFGWFGNGEYKMGNACDVDRDGTSKRCVLVEPLEFVPQTEVDPRADDPGEGYIKNAKCIQ